jgi:hypothetical protein
MTTGPTMSQKLRLATIYSAVSRPYRKVLEKHMLHIIIMFQAYSTPTRGWLMLVYQSTQALALHGWPLLAHLTSHVHSAFGWTATYVPLAADTYVLPQIHTLTHLVAQSQAVLGILMVVSSLAAKFFGLPQQIVANFKGKTSPVGYRWFIILGFVSYLTQSVQAAYAHDPMMVIAQAPGSVFTALLLIQMRLYKGAEVFLERGPADISSPSGIASIVTTHAPPVTVLTYELGDVTFGIPADAFIKDPSGAARVSRVFREDTTAGNSSMVIVYGQVPTGDDCLQLDRATRAARHMGADPNPGL